MNKSLKELKNEALLLFGDIDEKNNQLDNIKYEIMKIAITNWFCPTNLKDTEVTLNVNDIDNNCIIEIDGKCQDRFKIYLQDNNFDMYKLNDYYEVPLNDYISVVYNHYRYQFKFAKFDIDKIKKFINEYHLKFTLLIESLTIEDLNWHIQDMQNSKEKLTKFIELFK